ncbi:MAG: TonB-dependent receptor [Prolixibacteraceae bacterium]|nr:TonB-dependent receptor [Prolixibacteraceae bacterium]
MRKMLLFILLFVNFCLAAQEGRKIAIPKEYSTYPIIPFIDELAKQNQLTVFYKQEWITPAEVSFEKDSLYLKQVLDVLSLKGKFDYYCSESGKIYLIPIQQLVTQLPDYELKTDKQSGDSVYHEEHYLTGRNANLNRNIVVGKPGSFNQGRKVKIIGKLTEESTNEPLVGATIYIKNNGTGAASNGQGDIVIFLKPGVYSAVFQCMGMQEVNSSLTVHSSGSFLLSMSPSNVSIEEIVIKKESVKRGSTSGVESVDFLTMKEIPTLMGEKDVLKIAQMLPGIVSVSEGSGGVNVRGGNADQNLFYLNKIPVYNSSHLFGFFSSINSNIVENFAVYKGQMPVNYGGRLASVFDVKIRKPNKNEFFTEGGVSPISTNIAIETPLVRDKLGLMISGRSTYSNWILGQMEDPVLRNSKASFYDLLGSLDFNINQQSSLSLMVYLSKDNFNLNSLTAYSYGNSGGVLEFEHRFSPKVKLTSYLVNSHYQFQTIEQSAVSEAYEHEYFIHHNELKSELDWMPNKNHTMKAGVSSVLYHLKRGDVLPYGVESIRMPLQLGEERALESAFFLADEFKIGSRFTGYGGLRYSLFHELGPKTVRDYFDGVEKSDQTVRENNVQPSNFIISRYQGPEVRAGIDYKISSDGSLKMAYTQMRQYLFMLSNSISIAPTDQWKLADSHIKPEESKQYSMGYYHKFPRYDLLISGEVYYKEGNEIVEYKDGVDFLATPYVETAILQGAQDAYGAEFMISRDRGRLNGWFSYTYSRSIFTIDGINPWEKINNGKPYPSNYDKPHVMNLVLNWKINRRISFSGNMVYNTGRPITLPIGFYFLENYPYVDFSKRNEYRIPDYFRSDFSVKIEGNLKRNKPFHSFWMFSIYNLSGRNNVSSVFFKSEEGYVRGYQYSVIGVPLFTISWNWKLGDYANN